MYAFFEQALDHGRVLYQTTFERFEALGLAILYGMLDLWILGHGHLCIRLGYDAVGEVRGIGDS